MSIQITRSTPAGTAEYTERKREIRKVIRSQIGRALHVLPDGPVKYTDTERAANIILLDGAAGIADALCLRGYPMPPDEELARRMRVLSKALLAMTDEYSPEKVTFP